LQVASRLWVLWGVMDLAPNHIAHPLALVAPRPPLPGLHLSLATLLVAWGATEVIRYGLFAFKQVGLQPGALLWLRYSAFIVLYPLGVSSEMAMLALATPALPGESGKGVLGPLLARLSLRLPNRLNFAFEYATVCWLVMPAVYVICFPMLYGYMLGQRRKVLGGRVKVKAN
jgi:very-long-chain (3R)-3-hydroxyacyl-CoA dehydratase